MHALAVGLTLLAAQAQPQVPDTALYAEVTARFVTAEGRVDYTGLHNNIQPLDRFVKQLAQVSPDSHPQLFPSREEKLAYWLNTYNALVLWAFASEYPSGKDRLRSAVGRAAFFFARKFPVGGRERSLDDIEVNSVRKAFNEPRIHFALVCASTSCPPLSQRPYRAADLDAHLEEQTRRFLAVPSNLTVNEQARTLQLSSILKWYAGDFGGFAKVLEFLDKRRPNGTRLAGGKWRTEYVRYDWSINLAASK